MAGPVENSGSIETFAQPADAPPSRRSTYSFDEIGVGDRVALFFVAGDDTRPPYSLKIRAPNGQLVIDRILRELPTGQPQSEPPVTFVVFAAGKYAVEIRELVGKAYGLATIRVG